jgi:hypothetical protein
MVGFIFNLPSSLIDYGGLTPTASERLA